MTFRATKHTARAVEAILEGYGKADELPNVTKAELFDIATQMTFIRDTVKQMQPQVQIWAMQAAEQGIEPEKLGAYLNGMPEMEGLAPIHTVITREVANHMSVLAGQVSHQQMEELGISCAA